MNSITQEFTRQLTGIEPGKFICSNCKHYRGRLICSCGILIAVEGGNMSHCSLYQNGKKCPHCGRNI